MMWKFFLQKEKSKPFLNLTYLYLMFVFISNILDPIEGDFVIGGIIIFYIVSAVATLDTFTLLWFVQGNNDSSLANPSYSGLEVNLKMLSIPFKDFIKFNIIYGLLRTIPFLIVAIAFGGINGAYLTYFIFLAMVMGFNILIPLNTLITHNIRNIALDNKQEPRKTIKKKIKEYYAEKYPTYNENHTHLITSLTPVFIIVLFSGLIGWTNNFNTEVLNIIANSMLLIGSIAVVSVTWYQLRMVTKSQDEL